MKDLVKLCQLISDKNGNISCQDVLDCGYGMEHFAQLAQPTVNIDKLVEKANEIIATKKNNTKLTMEVENE